MPTCGALFTPGGLRSTFSHKDRLYPHQWASASCAMHVTTPHAGDEGGFLGYPVIVDVTPIGNLRDDKTAVKLPSHIRLDLAAFTVGYLRKATSAYTRLRLPLQEFIL